MTPPELHVVVPGPLDQLTGGYVYDAHMVAGLRALGWRVYVHNLAGSFPDPDPTARGALADVLDDLPDGSRVVIDGLAMGGVPAPIEEHGDRLRIVALVHHPLAEETGLSEAARRSFRERERRALAPCAGVVVSSEFSARGLLDYGVRPDLIRAVLPGTEPPTPAEGADRADPPEILCVASITPRKGHDVLVAALEGIRDLPWRCACAGSLERDREWAVAVRQRVTAVGLSDRIDFVGERAPEQLGELYARASVFALASHYEGYGMALAEALAHGLPVVSTRGGAIPFTVPGDAGILVAPGDAAAFGDALRAVLTPGAPRRGDLVAGARRHAQRLPRWADSAKAFAAAVDELTA